MKQTLVFLLLLLLPLAAFSQDVDPKVRFKQLAGEFKEVKKSAQWKDIKKRRDIVAALSDLDHDGVVPLLYQVFAKDREQICRIPAMIGLGRHGNFKALKSMTTLAVREKNNVYLMCLPLAFEHVTNEKIGPWIMKNLFKRMKEPVLRASLIQCLGLLRCSEAYEPILKMLSGGSRDVRSSYECLIALARIGENQAFDPIAPYLKHDNRVLRQGAVIALGLTGHPAAVEKVLPLATDVDPRVQEAVAEVIRARKAEEGIPALIEMLRTGRLRVMDTARRVLEEITGESFGIDPDAWAHWYKLKLKGELPPPGKSNEVGSVATYYGLKVFTDRVLFIVDVSGSMNAGEPMRIDTAREEITRTLDQLNKKTLFNLVGFASGARWWRDEEVEATPNNIKDAKEFIEKLPVGGGTNISDTFEEAFEKNKRVDTIFFLGDGSPSLGRHTEQEEILARIRWMNRVRKVRIHCIALIRGEVSHFGGRMGPGLGRGRSSSGERAYDEEEAARFLARLAAEHGGSFVKIDDKKDGQDGGKQGDK